VNAVAFVINALHCANSVANADDVVRAAVKSAQGRFRESSQSALHDWGIRENRDIGEIAIGLQRTKQKRSGVTSSGSCGVRMLAPFCST